MMLLKRGGRSHRTQKKGRPDRRPEPPESSAATASLPLQLFELGLKPDNLAAGASGERENAGLKGQTEHKDAIRFAQQIERGADAAMPSPGGSRRRVVAA
jgi:hypothetical protein